MSRNKLSVTDKTDDKSNYNYKPHYKEMGVLTDAAKHINNYLSPITGIENREKSPISPILCNRANYALERRRLHNRNKSENFSLFKGNSVNSEKYFELMKLNSNGNNCFNNVSLGVSEYIKSPIFHRRNNSNVTESNNNYENDNSLVKSNNNTLVNSANFNNNNKNFEVLDIKNNLFNIKSRRLDKKNLYNPRYNER